MAIKNLGDGTVTKLAADAKPTVSLYPPSTVLQNTDDRKRWINSATEWVPQEMMQYKKFKITKEAGGTTFVTDIYGKVVQSNSDTQLAVQAEIDAMPNNRVYEFEWDAFVFNMTNPLNHPVTATNGIKKIKHQGRGYLGRLKSDGGTTCLTADATFPTNRYFFEVSDPSSTSVNTIQLEIDGIQGANLNTINTKNVGFAKVEMGEYGGLECVVITNVFGSYMWRAIHLIGGVWWGRFQNLSFQVASHDFIGESFITLEDGGHIGSSNGVPKENKFHNVRLVGDFEFTNAIRLSGCGYNTFRDVFIDGYSYREAAIALVANTTTLGGVGNNLFDNVTIIDQNAIPAPDTRKGSLYLAATGTNKVWDNYFMNMRASAYPVTVRIEGANVFRNDIEFDAHFGSLLNVNDTGSDPTNTIRVKGGNFNTTGGDAKITHTGGISRVIDSRPGAQKTGTTTTTGNGTQQTFNIAHGCFASPAYTHVEPYSVAASAQHHTGSDSTNITLTYGTAPTNGASLIWVWRAEVYK